MNMFMTDFVKRRASWETIGTDVTNIIPCQKVDKKATVRVINGKEHILGIVGNNYKPVQNLESFNFFQAFIDNDLVDLETAGFLNNGAKTWVLASIKGCEDQKISTLSDGRPDNIKNYVLLSNAHDGTMAVRVGFVIIRVVCQNTLNLALRDTASKLIKVNHSQQVLTNLDKLRETMSLSTQQFLATAEQYKMLAQTGINQEDLKKYVKVVFSLESLENQLSDEGLSIEVNEERKSHLADQIDNLFMAGSGNKGETLWDAYNAVTEYNQYFRGNNASTDYRLNATWFGDAKRINEKALKTALALVK